MKHETEIAQPAPLGRVERVIWRGRAVFRWAAYVCAGMLLWMFGLLALDVPAVLESWRHSAGAALLVCAVHLWRRAVRI